MKKKKLKVLKGPPSFELINIFLNTRVICASRPLQTPDHYDRVHMIATLALLGLNFVSITNLNFKIVFIFWLHMSSKNFEQIFRLVSMPRGRLQHLCHFAKYFGKQYIERYVENDM